MSVKLPESLQKEAELLAQQKGIDLDTLIIQAVEQYLSVQQNQPPGVLESRRRLRELASKKLTKGHDFLADVRQAKSKAHQLYLENEDLLMPSVQKVAENQEEYKANSSE